MSATIRLSLEYPPPTNRLYRNWNGRMVLSDVARRYKADIARIYARTPLQGEITVLMDVYRPRKSGDLDGRIKCLLDSLQGIAYENDSQIVEIHARRFEDKANPRVEVEIKAAEREQP